MGDSKNPTPNKTFQPGQASQAKQAQQGQEAPAKQAQQGGTSPGAPQSTQAGEKQKEKVADQAKR